MEAPLANRVKASRLVLLLAAVVAALISTSSAAAVKVARLEELLRDAPVVAVARVIRVETLDGIRVAHSQVIEPLKGCKRGESFVLLAQRTWTCDVSDAAPGERALLALDAAPGSRRTTALAYVEAVRKRYATARALVIAHAGRGRFPITETGGKQWAQPSYGVRLPQGLAALQTHDRVPLSSLLAAARNIVGARPQTDSPRGPRSKKRR